LKTLTLKKGRERSVLRKHPWIFSGAVSIVNSDPQNGDEVIVQDSDGKHIAIALYCPFSNIRARVWDWDSSRKISKDTIGEKIHNAILLRKNLSFDSKVNAIRLIFAESDGLPGLIVDQYSDWIVIQILTAGMEKWKAEIIESIVEITGITNIYERSDVDVRTLEGLPERTGVLRGKEPPELIEIQEYDLKYYVDIRKGQKTGFYLDQRENRQKLRSYSKNKSALNCFSYSGGFSLNAERGGSEIVLSVDSSADALRLANKNTILNGLNDNKFGWLEADVFHQLRKFRDENTRFDLIILDPPKFAPTIIQVPKAARAYKDINLLALKLLNKNGILFTFSCSGGVAMDLFQKIIADAALDADADVKILEKLHQSADHPVSINFPEGEYLKGLICQKQ